MVKILLVDDHAIVRDGLKRIINDTTGMTVADEAENGQQALEKIWNGSFDLIILDITMPGRSGLEILKEIKQFNPKLPVLVLTMHSEEQYAVRILKSGASGYLTKDIASEKLVDAIRVIENGGKFVSPSIAELLIEGFEIDPDKDPHKNLSDREFQVLCMIASGKTVTDIAKEISLSDKTVSTYRSRVLEKMKMKNNAELTHYAITNKLVD